MLLSVWWRWCLSRVGLGCCVSHRNRIALEGAETRGVLNQMGAMAMFKTEFKNEWNRLNLVFRQADDGFWAVIKHGWQETWHGYFAPLWMLVWLAKYPLKIKAAIED